MKDFFIISIIASVVFTLALNILPVLFPKATRRALNKVQEKLEEESGNSETGQRPKVRVYFPWKLMLLGSVLLTIFLNLGLLFR